jgi:magnesium-transporting ATPase (P-type)
VPLIILFIASAISVALRYTNQDPTGNGWVDGIIIISGVFILAFIGALIDVHRYKQQVLVERARFRDELTVVLRNGLVQKIKSVEVVVGDIIVLSSGCKIAADAFLLAPDATVTVKEGPYPGRRATKTMDGDYFLLAPSFVTDCPPECKAVVVATGQRTQYGQTLLSNRRGDSSGDDGVNSGAGEPSQTQEGGLKVQGGLQRQIAQVIKLVSFLKR